MRDRRSTTTGCCAERGRCQGTRHRSSRPRSGAQPSRRGDLRRRRIARLIAPGVVKSFQCFREFRSHSRTRTSLADRRLYEHPYPRPAGQMQGTEGMAANSCLVEVERWSMVPRVRQRQSDQHGPDVLRSLHAAPGGPDVLRFRQDCDGRTRPSRRKGVCASRSWRPSVNPIDTRRRTGYGRRLMSLMGAAQFPLVLGNDFAGVVELSGRESMDGRRGSGSQGARGPRDSARTPQYTTVPAGAAAGDPRRAAHEKPLRCRMRSSRRTACSPTDLNGMPRRVSGKSVARARRRRRGRVDGGRMLGSGAATSRFGSARGPAVCRCARCAGHA